MNAEDKLFRDDLSEAEIRSLTREELSVWIIRPQRSEIASTKSWMMFRVVLLIALTAYCFYTFGTGGIAQPLLVLLFCYEFAYYNVRQEMAKVEDARAREIYRERVKELNRKQSRG